MKFRHTMTGSGSWSFCMWFSKAKGIILVLPAGFEPASLRLELRAQPLYHGSYTNSISYTSLRTYSTTRKSALFDTELSLATSTARSRASSDMLVNGSSRWGTQCVQYGSFSSMTRITSSSLLFLLGRKPVRRSGGSSAASLSPSTLNQRPQDDAEDEHPDTLKEVVGQVIFLLIEEFGEEVHRTGKRPAG